MNEIDREIALKPYHSVIPAKLNFELTKPTRYSDAEFDAAIEAGKWTKAYLDAGYGTPADAENAFMRTFNAMISNLNLNGYAGNITLPTGAGQSTVLNIPDKFKIDMDLLVSPAPRLNEITVNKIQCEVYGHDRAHYVGFTDNYDYCKTCGIKL